MKKRIAIALMLVLVFASLSLAAPKYEWKLSHIRPQDSPIDLDVKEFVKKVSERSEGRITINIFNSSGLGDYQVVHERVGLGSVDMAIQSMERSPIRFFRSSTSATSLQDGTRQASICASAVHDAVGGQEA